MGDFHERHAATRSPVHRHGVSSWDSRVSALVNVARSIAVDAAGEPAGTRAAQWRESGARDSGTAARIRSEPVICAGGVSQEPESACLGFPPSRERPQHQRRGILILKYLAVLAELGLFGSASALVGYDIFLSALLRKLLQRNRHV